MDDVNLTCKQAAGIMLALGLNDFKTLKTLVVSDNDLSKVEPNMLARAVNKLEKVNLKNSQLTLEQMGAILKQSLVKTSLKSLSMPEPLDGDMWLDEDLIDKARMAIRSVYFDKI